VLSNGRHPLLTDAVPNSITLAPATGVIVTGANMSGKSTFLRTVGVTTVLAQTINTCLASRYEAPVLAVRTCIGRADDPATGKSYYLVEVESVLALVHAARGQVPHVMLFDELFRGTNAVERIAAGEAVLRALLAPAADGRPSPHVVIAATHDQELVDLLEGIYVPQHFTDTIDAAGLAFDYRLQPGPATTRNAIALLEQRGAPPGLVAHALMRAQAFDRARHDVVKEAKPSPS
jgi:DNA mismatch repair ATPase MutS